MNPEPTTEVTVEGEGFNPLQLWLAVRKRWPMVAAIAAAVTVAVAFYTLGQDKIYQTKATVLIDPHPSRPLGREVTGSLEVGSSVYWSNREYYETQLQLITSRKLGMLTVQTLGLNRDAAFLTNRPQTGETTTDGIPVEDAANVLLSRIAVDPVKNTRLVEVSLEDANPERARRVLQTHIESYIQRNIDDEITDTGSAADWLRDQTEKLRAELDKDELAMHEYKKDKGILSVDLDDQTTMLKQQMTQLSTALIQVQVDRSKVLSRVAELDKVDVSDPDHLAASEFLLNPLINSLRERYSDADAERASLLARGKGDEHPDVRAITARQVEARDAVKTEVVNVKSSLMVDADALSKQYGALVKLSDEASQQALDLNLLEIDYRRLDRSRKSTERLFNLVLERSKDIDLTSQMRFNNIRIVDAAVTPRWPVRPNVPVNMGAGLLAGLVLGIAAALGREQLDRTIKSPEDLTQFGLTYLGLLPRVGMRQPDEPRRRRRKRKVQLDQGPELMVHEDPRSAIAEAARAIRTNIVFMSPDVPHRRLLVASAVPTEGKTTVACSIAIAMAQAGQRVLLIDCDLRRPRLHKIFRVSNDAGMTSVLLEPGTLDQAVRPTDIPNLNILTSGPIPPNPAELLHSDVFGRLLDELSNRFDRIVFDSAPLIPVTDATVLSTRVDATILVVKPFMTRREVVRHALRSLRDVGGKILGAVLNDLDLQRRDNYYYYQYHARYYYSYGDGPAPDKRAEPPQPSA